MRRVWWLCSSLTSITSWTKPAVTHWRDSARPRHRKLTNVSIKITSCMHCHHELNIIQVILMDAFMHLHLHLLCAMVLCRLSLPLSSFGMSTSSQRSGLILTVCLSKCRDELLEHLWRAFFFKKLLLKHCVMPYNALRYALEATSHFCVVLSRLLTYKAAACWTRGHLQIDCNWTTPLTSAVASWGMWWKQGYMCWVCEQMSVCVQTWVLWHHVWTYVLLLFTYLWQIIAQTERAAPKCSGLYKSLILPIWISGWTSLQIWCHGPDLITRSFFSLLPQGLVGWFPITPWYLFGMLGTSAE